MTPEIYDPIPHRGPLPLMYSVQDAAKIAAREGDNFYVSAFLFQCWLCELTLGYTAQLAEKTDPKNRSFQSGQAWRGFLKVFGRASDTEFPHIFSHLMEFAYSDDSIAHFVLEAAAPLGVEHQLTGRFLGDRTPTVLRQQPKKLLALLRTTVARLCDWLDSVCQFRTFQEWHVMPDSFDPDPQIRELTYLGINQRHFDELDLHSQARWLNHMADTAQELKRCPKWAAYHQSRTGPVPDPRPWPSLPLDRSIIKLWPVLKLYRWSATDLLCVLRQVLPPADLAPCADAAALVAYCADPLSLRHPSLKSHRPHLPQPPAAQLAFKLCAPRPEATPPTDPSGTQPT